VRPDGELIAVHFANTHVAFLRPTLDDEGVPTAVVEVGEPLEVGKWVSMGVWARDGRHYLVADTGWGPGRLDAARNGPGHIRSVRPAEDGSHVVVSSAEVSLSPEGFALDPSGRLIAAVNMERTYLPEAFPYRFFGRRERSSISLVAFDPETGRLDTVDGPLAFDGVLPEHASFDADGDALAVAVFHEKAETPTRGWVELFAIGDDDGPRIRPTGRRTPVTRGAHALAVCHAPRGPGEDG